MHEFQATSIYTYIFLNVYMCTSYVLLHNKLYLDLEAKTTMNIFLSHHVCGSKIQEGPSWVALTQSLVGLLLRCQIKIVGIKKRSQSSSSGVLELAHVAYKRRVLHFQEFQIN